MIEITIYNNGFEINGHSPDKGICGEVCLSAWIVANELFYDGINVKYDASVEGLTWIILDKTCEKSMHQLELYKSNVTKWKHNWKDHVAITEVNADLIKYLSK